MNDVLLYTLPQWLVFAALFMVIYGWIENIKRFRLIGISIFILLGIFSLFVLLGDYLAVGKFLTPNEVASEELDDEILNEIPIQAQLLPGYWSFVIASLMAIPSLILDWADKKYSKLLVILTALVALAGFFIVVGTVRGM